MIPIRATIGITITEKERSELTRYSRGRSTPARVVFRAKIVLLAAEGKMNKEIVAALKTDAQTVKRWRTCFAVRRLAGIVKDAPRGGRKPTVRERLASLIVKKTTQERPADATHWSTRSLAAELVSEIMTYIDKHNKKPKSFLWTAKSADILAKVERARAVLHNVPSV